MASGDTKTEALLRILGHGGSYDGISGSGNTKTQDLLVDAIGRIQNVEDDVEELKNNPDVVDIVDTYADLQAYDTSTLTDKDIIRVLEDSTHDNGSTYYRWNATTNQFDYIGEAGGGGPTVVQTTGQSTTDVMSQKATTDMVYGPYGQGINIGANSGWDDAVGSIFIGKNAAGSDNYGEISIGNFSESLGYDGSIALGYRAKNGYGGAAIGSFSEGEDSGIIGENFGTISVGSKQSSTFTDEFGNSRTIPAFTRRVVNVHDPVDAHDAATKGYVDANAGGSATFYMSVTPYPYTNLSRASLYSDIALTTAVPASTFVQALRDCKSVFLVYKSGDSDWSARRIAQIISSYVPNADTAEAYDEVFPAGYYFDGSAGNRYIIQSATSDPDDTASFDIEKLN